MAGTSVLKLKVDDREYNASLKQAQQGMQHLEQALKGAGKSFAQVDKSVADNVRGIGQMEAQSKTARGRINEMSNAFVELSMQYNKMSDNVKNSDVGKALSDSMTQLKQRTIEAKKELDSLTSQLNNVKTQDVKGGGMFSGFGDKMSGALQVFGGNLMTTAAGAVANLGSELADTVKQGIELAKQGEGIRMAFERLNQPGLIENLKEATHGTVAELELMQNAIKFENFNLPVKDLGTFLAFAQQKAKDTGQSIDYLVSSIVDGLGRQSKQILDNLGISAAELTKRMSEGADMTTAVADIIRDEMSKAGDYVETAADRAARAAARATDKMEEVGRTAMPVAEEWAETWGIIKEGALDLLNTAIGPLARSLASLRKIWAGVDWDKLTDSPFNIDKYPNQGPPSNKPGNDHVRPAKGGYVEVTDTNTGKVIGGRHFDNLNDANSINAWRASLHKTGSGRSSGGRKSNDVTYAADSSAAREKRGQELTQKWREAGAAVRDAYKAQLDEAKKELAIMQNPGKAVNTAGLVGLAGASISAVGGTMNIPDKLDIKTPLEMMNENLNRLIALRDSAMTSGEYQAYAKAAKSQEGDIAKFKGEGANGNKIVNDIGKVTEQMGQITGGISDITGGLEQLGVEIPEGINKAVSAIQAVSTILTGIAAIVTLIKGEQTVQTTASWVDALIPFSHGGVVRAAGGYVVPGNFGYDAVPSLLTSGEVVLNKAQQGVLASQLSDNGGGRGYTPSHVSGEQIWIALNAFTKRTGRGELVTWR